MVRAIRIVSLLALAFVTACRGSASPPVPTVAGQLAATSPASAPAGVAGASPLAPAPAGGSPSPSPSPSPPPSPTPVPLVQVRVATTPSLGAWQLDVAEQKGFLRALGIGLQQQREDTLNVAEAVNGRGADVGVATVGSLVRAVKDGQNLTLVAGGVNKAALTLVAARDVDDLGALRGKLVGVRDRQDVTAALARRMLRPRGLADVELIAFPDPRVRAAAVANGTTGASLLEPGQAARLQAAGFRGLVVGTEAAGDFQQEGVIVRGDWARSNEELLVRVLRGIVQADRWIYAPANRAEAIDILAGTLRITADEAARVYEEWVERNAAIPREGEFEPAGVRAVVELLAEVEAIRPPLPDPTRLADQTFVTRARSTGTGPSPVVPGSSPSPASPAPARPSPSPAVPRPSPAAPSPAPR